MNTSRDSSSTSRISGCEVYTDGGAHNNDPQKGLGAWAFAQYDKDATSDDTIDVYAGHIVEETTNNRAEMMAVIQAVKFYPIHTNIDIISDSGYVVKGYNHPAYLDRWVANGWKLSTNKPVLNQDLWQQILNLSYQYGVKYRLIKGHYKDPNPTHAFWNSIVDRACTFIMQEQIMDEYTLLKFNLGTKKFVDVQSIIGG